VIEKILTEAFPGQQWTCKRDPGATPEEQYAGLEWSGPATKPTLAEILAAELTGEQRASQKMTLDRDAAKAAVTATTPAERANRAAQRVVYKSVRGVIQQLNAIRLHVLDPQANPMPAALPVRTWQQLLAAVRADIDAETDPES